MSPCNDKQTLRRHEKVLAFCCFALKHKARCEKTQGSFPVARPSARVGVCGATAKNSKWLLGLATWFSLSISGAPLRTLASTPFVATRERRTETRDRTGDLQIFTLMLSQLACFPAATTKKRQNR